MECPKCRKKISDSDAVCRNCGIALKEEQQTIKGFAKLFKKDKKKKKNAKTKPPSLLETTEIKKKKLTLPTLNAKNEKKIKLGFFFAAAVLVIILIFVIIIKLTGDAGAKKALEAADYIGGEVTEVEKDLNISFSDRSQFGIINDAVVFDYIYESDGDVEIDGIKYPEWSVMITQTASDYIEKVIYTNYKSIRKDARGEKLKSRINLDSVDKGARFASVSDKVDLDPFKIIYTSTTISYVYRYYYITSDDNVQSVILTTVFDTESEYMYYTSVDVYPQNM